ncbi:relaxase/mobilization nuclease domain-containing protein [Flavitalea sp. BT771]|uniref:relaxase/mobilization nuclease domain-containing protein n=1 Tax=Flavitalea sp. BT771 TaxID=3063329 RepID=UPI0026E14CCD|nr:relaxase/mobilization nuclease domain-containing protein [Flavitalea sp. BT771]MDO6435392.1 relaxase/mobilization nuclease domain-containing protein [Flavitalea sp. BT771]MDV6224248.1 relaxase/mobilization nuclease domain-containing protein [Flavitalea sp. BT771]
MFGTTSTGRSARLTLDYCLTDKLTQSRQVIYKDRAEILYCHHCYGDKEELAQQFREVIRLRRDISEPVMHLSLSLPPGEQVARSKLVQLGKECATHMDFEKHQYVVIQHKDTFHQHIHVVANRIGFDRHATSNSFSLRRLIDYCRQAELRHGLRQELSPPGFLTEEQRQVPRHGIRLDKLKENITETLLVSQDVTAFKALMEEKGYTVYLSERGIAFKDENHVVIRGYEAGYPFHKIESTLSLSLSLRQEQERLRLAEEQRLKQEQELHQRHEQWHRHTHSHSLSL